MAVKKLAKPTFDTASPLGRARCVQCGNELRYVPFPLSHVMCQGCYGIDRNHRPVTVTERVAEVVAVEEEAAH